MKPSRRTLLIFVTGMAGVGALSGCMTAYKKSVGADAEKVAVKSFNTDFNDAWQATLDSLKSVRLDVSNRDAGFLQTRWVDNTAQKNFVDGDGIIMPYMNARFRFKINVAPAMAGNRPIVKVSVQKEQLIQKDALEDSRYQESDLIEENTLLYRIGRIITVKARLAQAEKERIEREMKTFDPTSLGGESTSPQ